MKWTFLKSYYSSSPTPILFFIELDSSHNIFFISQIFQATRSRLKRNKIMIWGQKYKQIKYHHYNRSKGLKLNLILVDQYEFVLQLKLGHHISFREQFMNCECYETMSSNVIYERANLSLFELIKQDAFPSIVDPTPRPKGSGVQGYK